MAIITTAMKNRNVLGNNLGTEIAISNLSVLTEALEAPMIKMLFSQTRHVISIQRYIPANKVHITLTKASSNRQVHKQATNTRILMINVFI